MIGSFNLEGARKSGYSDGEIASFLASQHGFNIDAARKSGYKDDEIVSFLASSPKPTKASTSAPAWTESGAEFAPEANVPRDNTRQSQVSSDINSVGQGLVGGVGSAVAGVGRGVTAGMARSTQNQISAMERIDNGENVSSDQDPLGYQDMSPGQRDKAREDLIQAGYALQDRAPNAMTRTGVAMQKLAKDTFPVLPEHEGVQTSVGRLIGGSMPALAATAAGSAVGGPPGGILAGMATIGAQTYDTTYQDAIAKGATPEHAEVAAGKSAAMQAVTMAVPVGRLMQRVPMPLREGLTKTLINLGQHGVEFGSANALGTFANNYVARETYDPGRSLTEGTGEAGLEGAIAGLIIPSVAGIARSRPTVDTVLKAPDVDAAIVAAREASQTSALDYNAPFGEARVGMEGVTGPRTEPLSGGSPDFVPPNAEAPTLPRILSLLNEDTRIGANRPDFVPPSAEQPSIPKGWGEIFAAKPTEQVGGLQSVGAAASREGTPPGQIDMSFSDMKANRRRAEQDELMAPPETNDRMIHVPGSFPTLAERSADPKLSQLENLYRQRNPDKFIGEGKPLTENNRARVAEFDTNTVPDPVVRTMEKDRRAQWVADSEGILPEAKPADLTPAWGWVSKELEKPRIQENDAIRKVLEDYQGRLLDEDGNLKTDPAAVWGMHDHLQNLLAKAKDPLNMTSAEKFAEAQILEAKRLTDQILNTATDNKFQTALDNYAEASKAINSAIIMNDFRPKLTNMAGDLQAANFHRFVLGLAKERGDPGIDPSMDISDKTMRSLINIDKDLKRASLIKLGAAAGSPTNLLGALAESAGIDAAHSVLGAIPGVGPVIKGLKGAVQQYQLDRETAKHLAPPEGGYIYPDLRQQGTSP